MSVSPVSNGRLLRTQKREDLFWAKVLVSEGCWLWDAAKSSTGYGIFGCSTSGISYRFYSHRVSFDWYGEEDLGKGTFVCHHCDNPLCVNPHHLFQGSHIENMIDMKTKNRHVGNRTLRIEEVVRIRNLKAAGKTSRSLAEVYNVSEQQISGICRGKFWPNAPGPLSSRKLIKPSLVVEIRKDLARGLSYNECAKTHGVSAATVGKINRLDSGVQNG